MSRVESPDLRAFFVVIPAFNGGSVLKKCLQSLLRLSEHVANVTIVDNASTDGSMASVAASFPNVRILRQVVNRGFAAACNIGLEFVADQGVDSVLILNQDTAVSPGLAKALIASMNDHPRAAVVAPKTYLNGHSASPQSRILYAGAYHRRWPLRLHLPGLGEVDTGAYDEPRQVDVAWGHGMFVRVSAVRQVGLFDEDFFLYHEDVDLCDRLRHAGWQVWYEPKAVMWHDVCDPDRARGSQLWRWKHKVDSAWTYHRKRAGAASALSLTSLTVVHELVHLLRLGERRAASHLAYAACRRLLRSAASRGAGHGALPRPGGSS